MIPSVRASRVNASSTSASADRRVLGAADGVQVGVLGPDARVVEPGRDRLGLLDLAVLVLHQVAAHAVDDAGDAAPDGGAAGRLDADEPGVGVDERRRTARWRWSRRRRRRRRRRGRRRSARGTARGPRRRSPGGTRAPSTGTGAGPSPSRGSSSVDSTVATQSRSASLTASLSVRLPLSTASTSAPSRRMRNTLSSWRCDVDGAHVHLALEAHQRRRGGRGDAVLAGAGLGDEPRLAHPLGEQRLAEHVVDLVRAGVVEVLALEQQAQPELRGRGCGTR